MGPKIRTGDLSLDPLGDFHPFRPPQLLTFPNF